jgi:hypothetical protein
MQIPFPSLDQIMLIGQSLCVLGAAAQMMVGNSVPASELPPPDRAQRYCWRLVAAQATFGGILLLLQSTIVILLTEGDGLPASAIALSLAVMLGYAALFGFLFRKILPADLLDSLGPFEKISLGAALLAPLALAVACVAPYWM